MHAVYDGRPAHERNFDVVNSAQFGARRNTKSVQKVSKQGRPLQGGSCHFGKADIRYWQERVFRPVNRRNGMAHAAADWAIKVQHVGRRETFSLGTPNQAAAAARAKQLYLLLQAAGWDAVIKQYKPKAAIRQSSITTVGDHLAQASSLMTARPKTIASYGRALRSIVGQMFNIQATASRFDPRPKGGHAKWRARVDAVHLKDITPARVQAWKLRFLARAGANPVRQKAARGSVNSLIRQAKSLFSPKILQFLDLEADVVPFRGAIFERRTSTRYQSHFDVQPLIASAKPELPKEQLKIFYLALMAGLRRNEIDKLEWDSFRWTQGAIRIDTTAFLQPKSEDSIGDVCIDAEVVTFFQRAKRAAKGNFVIESEVSPRIAATYSHYRCQRHFDALTKWLRSKGVNGQRPLHTLRKEFGSRVCARHGIYAASRALRHADIAITSQHYLEPKRRATVGLGRLLSDAHERE